MATALKLALKSESSVQMIEKLGEMKLEDRLQGYKFLYDSQRPELIKHQTFASNNTPYDEIGCADYIHQIYWKQPDCTDAGVCSDVGPLECASQSAATSAWSHENVKPTKCVTGGFQLGVDAWACEYRDTPAQRYLDHLRIEVLKMMRQKEDACLQVVALDAGLDYTSTAGDILTPIDLPLFSATAPIKPQPMAMSKVLREFRKQAPQSTEAPMFITGSDTLSAYLYANDVFANNTDGFDPNRGKMSASNWYLHEGLPATLTAAGALGDRTDNVLAIIPGTFTMYDHLYHTNDYFKMKAGESNFVDNNLKVDGNVVRMTRDLGTPFVGIPFFVDILLQKSDCDRTVDVQLKHVYDVWTVPTADFCPAIGQGTRDFNWKLFYNIKAEDMTYAAMTSNAGVTPS